jgi:hypothetical protein
LGRRNDRALSNMRIQAQPRIRGAKTGDRRPAIEGKLLREIAEAVGVSKAYAHKVVSEAGLRRRTGYVRTGDS